jgi:hypothetical protein
MLEKSSVRSYARSTSSLSAPSRTRISTACRIAGRATQFRPACIASVRAGGYDVGKALTGLGELCFICGLLCGYNGRHRVFNIVLGQILIAAWRRWAEVGGMGCVGRLV